MSSTWSARTGRPAMAGVERLRESQYVIDTVYAIVRVRPSAPNTARVEPEMALSGSASVCC
jgi:hypothetical protein